MYVKLFKRLFKENTIAHKHC